MKTLADEQVLWTVLITATLYIQLAVNLFLCVTVYLTSII